jgi:hypothetical protein
MQVSLIPGSRLLHRLRNNGNRANWNFFLILLIESLPVVRNLLQSLLSPPIIRRLKANWIQATRFREFIDTDGSTSFVVETKRFNIMIAPIADLPPSLLPNVRKLAPNTA